ncbi:Uncharacterised protein [Legionella quinlivanii]|nr:Uncharacterised protein [Legionella quinlivanii]
MHRYIILLNNSFLDVECFFACLLRFELDAPDKPWHVGGSAEVSDKPLNLGRGHSQRHRLALRHPTCSGDLAYSKDGSEDAPDKPWHVGGGAEVSDKPLNLGRGHSQRHRLALRHPTCSGDLAYSKDGSEDAPDKPWHVGGSVEVSDKPLNLGRGHSQRHRLALRHPTCSGDLAYSKDGSEDAPDKPWHVGGSAEVSDKPLNLGRGHSQRHRLALRHPTCSGDLAYSKDGSEDAPDKPWHVGGSAEVSDKPLNLGRGHSQRHRLALRHPTCSGDLAYSKDGSEDAPDKPWHVGGSAEVSDKPLNLGRGHSQRHRLALRHPTCSGDLAYSKDGSEDAPDWP